jgi:hypothetical protein
MTRADPVVAVAAAIVDDNLKWMIERLRSRQPWRWQDLLGELYLFSVRELVVQMKIEAPRDNARWLGHVMARFFAQRLIWTFREGYPKSCRKTMVESETVGDDGLKRRGATVLDVDGREDPPDQAITYAEALALLDRLAPVCRDQVLLRLAGTSVTEIAARYGENFATVSTRLRLALAELQEPALQAGYEPPSTDGSAAGNRKLERFPVEKQGLRSDAPRTDLDSIIVERGPHDWTLAYHDAEDGHVDGVTIAGNTSNTSHVLIRCSYSDGTEALHLVRKGGKIQEGHAQRLTKIEAQSADPGQKITLVATHKASPPACPRSSTLPPATPVTTVLPSPVLPPEAPAAPPRPIPPPHLAPAPALPSVEPSPSLLPAPVITTPPVSMAEIEKLSFAKQAARFDEVFRAGERGEEFHVLLYGMANGIAKGISAFNCDISKQDLAGEMYAHMLHVISLGKMKVLENSRSSAYVRTTMNRRAWEVVEKATAFKKVTQYLGEAMHTDNTAFEATKVTIRDRLDSPIEKARKAKASGIVPSIRSNIDEELQALMAKFFGSRVASICEHIESFPPNRRSEKLARLYGILDGLQEVRREFLGTYCARDLPRVKFTKSRRITRGTPIEALSAR